MKQNKTIYIVTGGIGSGKSRLLEALYNLGCNIIQSDMENREILKKPSYIRKIKKLFPGTVIDNKIDRAQLAKQVFSDKSKLELLNKLSHPLIINKINKKIKKMSGDIFIEISAFDEELKLKGLDYDKIIYVHASDARRTQRVLQRDSRTKFDIERIIKLQNYNLFCLKSTADYVIDNNDNADMIIIAKQLLNDIENEK